MEEKNVQVEEKRTQEVDHLDVFNAFHDDVGPLIDLCCDLAEKGLGDHFEKAWKYLEDLDRKNGPFDDDDEGAFDVVTLACISAGFTLGFIFGRKYLIKDKKISAFVDRTEQEYETKEALYDEESKKLHLKLLIKAKKEWMAAKKFPLQPCKKKEYRSINPPIPVE